jgi:nitrogenase molybdenum-iron protein beta chain
VVKKKRKLARKGRGKIAMSEVLRNPRHGCDLHGALQTLEDMPGVVPIVHAGAGCVYQNYLAHRASGYAAGELSGPQIPATEVIEKQIVFGGASRLREEIKNAAKILRGDLYVVLGSCEAAMVGDDLAAMVKEAADIGIPVIAYASAGFRGGSHTGYAQLMKTIVRQLPSVKNILGGKTPGLVNVTGILPKADPFYRGDLQELERLLAGAGIHANTFFGSRGKARDREHIAQAEHTLVFSHWGIPVARELEELYGIAYTVFDSLPMGISLVRDFFSRLSSLVHTDEEETQNFLTTEEEKYAYYMEAFANAWYTHALSRRVALVGDTAAVIRFSSFLRKCLGTVVSTAVITDIYAQGEEARRPSVLDGLAGEVFASRDGQEIGKIIDAADVDMVLGSSQEALAARSRGIPHLEISAPVESRVFLDKTYAGTRGALCFLEDYAEAVMRGSYGQDEKIRRLLRPIVF